MTGTCLIVGAGSGLSASCARLFAAEGYDIALAARNIDKLDALAAETGASVHALDGSDAAATRALVDGLPGRLSVAIYNPSARSRGPLIDLDPDEVKRAVEITAFGSFALGQAAARRMLAQDGDVKGTILFTGASAGVKGFAKSASFAMGKFAQRGLAQSMSRELHPQGVHVAWINVDGGIRNPDRPERIPQTPDAMLEPDAIAQTYLALVRQHRSAWSHEIAVRPWVENF
ncbi:SDR family NAD(P)-dependent oxidoreductase [Pseudaestuariivita atlantica]|uniref:Oxidoreductase n=1 Tax=Pseudaestuariivita atlantica TaxID=1317121 RepID=A0A0L1JPS6_9RHOB|nr:SDR family NAD(P)-dependent oxidoreductase [Pseudaestuariivita atlantica]KNG93769.1 oxidoreductase [Pseudaestuariivita atlantica]